ncbi:MAG TPA: hypothetical protein VIY73_09670 [Polyangiaceae bacterium]
MLVAVGCILASARRLAIASCPTTLDAGVLLAALEGKDRGAAAPRVQAVVLDAESVTAAMAEGVAGWEKDLGAALKERDEGSRDALVEEQLVELDWVAQRWARVPRVCASIATSGGFLFGSVALLQGLALPADEGASSQVNAALFAALDAVTIGIAATSFCAAIHVRTRRLVRDRLAGIQRLVELLRAGQAAGHSGRTLSES